MRVQEIYALMRIKTPYDKEFLCTTKVSFCLSRLNEGFQNHDLVKLAKGQIKGKS